MKAVLDTIFAYGAAIGSVVALFAFFAGVAADRYEAEFYSLAMTAGVICAVLCGVLLMTVRIA